MTIILIPSLEPDEKLTKLVRDGLQAALGRWLIVDDGSSEGCQPIFAEIETMGCTVLHHGQNRGKGQALKTGIGYVKEHWPDADGIVTADADGQHTLTDIARVIAEMRAHPNALTLGERALMEKNVPFKSRFGNRLTSLVFFLSTGIRCVDTQTGLRGIPPTLFDRALALEGSRYEYEMNMLTEFARAKIPFRYLTIETIYIDDNRQSHFHAIRDSYRIYKTPLRFALASFMSAVVDIGLFSLFSKVFNVTLFAQVGLATVLARLISGSLNFTLNRKWSFHSHGQISAEAIRYLILFFSQMTVSALLVSGFTYLTNGHKTLIKFFVDTALFFVSYQIQHRWVYRNRIASNTPQGKDSAE